jgi:hypothetical protein
VRALRPGAAKVTTGPAGAGSFRSTVAVLTATNKELGIMRKMKLLATLVCAFAVLAFAAPALAQEAELACGEVEKGTWTFHNESEMNEFLEDLAAEAAENCTSEEVEDEWMIDYCWAVGPIAHAVSTLRWEGTPDEVWTTTTNIQWHPNGYYYISAGSMPPGMFANVDTLKVIWRHPGGIACLYCYQGSPWRTRHWESNWTNMDTQSCSSFFGTWYYFGTEETYFTNGGVDYRVANFNSNPPNGVQSIIYIVYP